MHEVDCPCKAYIDLEGVMIESAKPQSPWGFPMNDVIPASLFDLFRSCQTGKAERRGDEGELPRQS